MVTRCVLVSQELAVFKAPKASLDLFKRVLESCVHHQHGRSTSLRVSACVYITKFAQDLQRKKSGEEPPVPCTGMVDFRDRAGQVLFQLIEAYIGHAGVLRIVDLVYIAPTSSRLARYYITHLPSTITYRYSSSQHRV